MYGKIPLKHPVYTLETRVHFMYINVYILYKGNNKKYWCYNKRDDDSNNIDDYDGDHNGDGDDKTITMSRHIYPLFKSAS